MAKTFSKNVDREFTCSESFTINLTTREIEYIGESGVRQVIDFTDTWNNVMSANQRNVTQQFWRFMEMLGKQSEFPGSGIVLGDIPDLISAV